MPNLKIGILPVTPLQQNCTLMWDEDTMKGAVFDPGGDIPQILEAITEIGFEAEKIFLTHGHIDHAGGAAELKEKLGIDIEGPHEDDGFLLESLVESGAQYGLQGARNVTPDRLAQGRRHGELRAVHLRDPPLPRPRAGACGVHPGRVEDFASLATCCSRDQSAAPTFPMATMMP